MIVIGNGTLVIPPISSKLLFINLFPR
jgi:hypothetical protein